MFSENLSLFTPAPLGPFTLPNRIFMAPMTRNRADNPGLAPTALHATYYAQRAGAGLIISEGVPVSPQGAGYVNVPGLYSQKQIEGWRLVTEAVHRAGGRIFAQLWHVGRLSHPDFHNGQLPVAPSAIDPETNVLTPLGKKSSVTPKELSVEEIKAIVQDFAQAGENALAAGFDGVEIHSSNGYLFHQFFNNSSNRRADAYGGNDENKARFLFEVIEALSARIPSNCIGLRLNPMMHGRVGILVDEQTAATFDHIARRLNDYELAYLHLTRQWRAFEEPHFVQDVIGHYRKIYRGFLIANGNYDSASAQTEIAADRADAIAFGRPFIANPDLPARFQNGWPLAESDPATHYTAGEKGYVDYRAWGQ